MQHCTFSVFLEYFEVLFSLSECISKYIFSKSRFVICTIVHIPSISQSFLLQYFP